MYRDSLERLYLDTTKRIPELQEKISENLPEPAKKVNVPGPLRSVQSAVKKATDSVQKGSLTPTGIVAETNIERVREGLSPLSSNNLLAQAADAKVRDMFARGYFDHRAPDGTSNASELAEKQGYSYIVIGENLALGNFLNDDDVVEAWMNSPGHRANIVNKSYSQIGVAVKYDTFEGRKTWIAVQIFGRPSSECPKADSELKSRIDANKAKLDAMKQQLADKRARMDSMERNTPQYKAEVASYNTLVDEYNALIQATKTLVEMYNREVEEYNKCAGN